MDKYMFSNEQVVAESPKICDLGEATWIIIFLVTYFFHKEYKMSIISFYRNTQSDLRTFRL